MKTAKTASIIFGGLLLCISSSAAFADQPDWQKATAAAKVARQKGNYAEAVAFYKQALEMQEKYADAEIFYKKAIQIREKNLGPEHPDVIRTREIYAAMLRQEGHKTEAHAIEVGPVKVQLNNFQKATP